MAPNNERKTGPANLTLVIVKPDAVRRGLKDNIMDAYLEEGFLLLEELTLEHDRSFWEQFYVEHRERNFFNDLVTFMASGRSVALLVQGGDDVITRIRELHGGVMPEDQPKGSIRQRFMETGSKPYENTVHASDSPEAAHRELTMVFRSLYTQIID